MNQKNFIKQKLYAGLPVLGMWSIINAPMNAEVAAAAGLDFQIFDMEHGVYDMPSLDACIRSCEAVGCSPIVRVPALDGSIIQNCLDMGAHGVMVPQIHGYDEAVAAVKLSKFAPQGCRGFNPFTRAAHYNPLSKSNDTKINNDFAMTSIIVENKTAYQALDEILTIAGLDIIYLGIYDMSFALGHHGNINHPDLDLFVTSAIAKIKKANKFSAVMVQNESDMQKYIELGVNVIACGVDTYIYYSAIKNKLNVFNALTSVARETIK